MSEIERVEEIRKFFNFNKKTFTKILGNSTPQSYTNFLNGTSGLSMKMIKALKDHDSRVNIDWILTGQGTMFIGGNENTQTISNKDGKISHIANNSHNTTAESSKEVEYLKRENEHLKKALEDKDEIIRLLKNQK
ncbi:hypothetical protein [Aureispira anguillae]|uniref:Bacteriophage CI repressor helix-turn-helix domain-containing protein n=1 Tax=Aureispira anguillae TaxID=2864201 RepID=A0A915YFZ0_9BACT|nr:hypothetical protein [Aureispira anguillae]BDS12315.1 hypothetical protein AsAng_0030360 [Aureispira anguillae]